MNIHYSLIELGLYGLVALGYIWGALLTIDAQNGDMNAKDWTPKRGLISIGLGLTFPVSLTAILVYRIFKTAIFRLGIKEEPNAHKPLFTEAEIKAAKDAFNDYYRAAENERFEEEVLRGAEYNPVRRRYRVDTTTDEKLQKYLDVVETQVDAVKRPDSDDALRYNVEAFSAKKLAVEQIPITIHDTEIRRFREAYESGLIGPRDLGPYRGVIVNPLDPLDVMTAEACEKLREETKRYRYPVAKTGMTLNLCPQGERGSAETSQKNSGKFLATDI